MAVSILISGQKKVVADVISVGLITGIGDSAEGIVTSIYTGSDWLECDGSAVSRTTYADLFAVISTRFGAGDGSTTFNLPNANPTLITGAYTFGAFLGDTVVSVANTSAISINISAGAIKDGVRVTIIHQSTQELTITTGTDMNCVLSTKGTLVLVWDGDASQWCLVGENARILKSFTENGSWKTPFGALYKLSPVGGGGGGGGAQVNVSGSAYGGGGAGGSCQQYSQYIQAGTPLSITIGTGGTGGSGSGSGGTGGNSSITGTNVIPVYGMGGGGGGGALGEYGTSYGIGGAVKYPTTALQTSLELAGNGGQNGSGGSSGAGGKSAYNGGAGGAAKGSEGNGNPGSNYGGGGGGAVRTSGGSQSGGAGAGGMAYIEY